MSKAAYLRTTLLVAAALAASGCGIIGGKGRPKTPVLGERIPVLTSETDVEADPDAKALPFSLPAATENAAWTESGGSASNSMGQLALRSTLQPAFTVQAGRGNSVAARLAAPPIVADGRVFTIDTLGTVRAFDARTGGSVWTSQTPNERGNEASLYGGGLAYDGGRIFATNGLGHVAAMNAQTGKIVWRVRPGGPLRGSPTVANDAVYVMSQDNQIYSLNAANGATNWSQAAALEIAGIFGAGSPAAAQGTVVAGFSSGELNAYRYENGRQVWQDTLQRTSISTSVASLSDIDADPVIDNGQVFAIGAGGRMVALDLVSGQRLWELNIAGISTPWLAGDWIFAVTQDAKLISIYRQNGHIRWIAQLPQFANAKRKKGDIAYAGPVLAGNRLIVTSTSGAVIQVDPATGSFLSQTRVGAPVSLRPVVAMSTLYVLDDQGKLHAYR
ncbi:MAG TPA: PQQ-binding-like beta-propeller repeat protein [Sphingomicrobium sp.]|jgi:outer membrane protein assembly factor BamB